MEKKQKGGVPREAEPEVQGGGYRGVPRRGGGGAGAGPCTEGAGPQSHLAPAAGEDGGGDTAGTAGTPGGP